MTDKKELFKKVRKNFISFSPGSAEKIGRFYVRFLLPFLPARLFAVKKMIGEYGPFLFHPRFFFRDFSSWGIERNVDFRVSVEECRGKKCVIDIGAHIGLVSIPVSSVLGEGGMLYSFEPADFDRHYFSENVRLNAFRNVDINDYLVGKEYKENVDFYQQMDESGVSSVVIHNKRPERYVKKLKTQISIDKFCADKGLKPDVIKIDAEGNEFDILEGAKETLKQSKPVLFISLHGGHLTELGRDISEIYEIAENLNYSFTYINGTSVPPEKLRTAEYVMRPQKVI